VIQLSLDRFLARLQERDRQPRHRPFCFVLGAGASVQSDIPTGAQLIDRWLSEMQRQEGVRDESLADWTVRRFGRLRGFSFSRRAEYYGQIYEKRFRNKEQARGFLEGQLLGKEPSYGYSILARILANTRHKAVITTNFDHLVSDALFLYSDQPPIVCGHESLAEYVTPRLNRPLVVKIHRDILLNPLNTQTETAVLHRAWRKALRELFRCVTPIFIGYGGNDGSLMGFLETLPAETPAEMYWCMHRGTSPNVRVRRLLRGSGRFLVEIDGFDELMLLIKFKLNIGDLLPLVETRHRFRVRSYQDRFASLAKRLSKLPASSGGTSKKKKIVDDAVGDALHKLERARTPDSWILRAKAENDDGKARKRYAAAERRFPHHAEVLVAFAEFLSRRRQQSEKAEELFKAALKLDPDDHLLLYDYATFLWYSQDQGRLAKPLLEKVVARRNEILGSEHIQTLNARDALASALQGMGRLSDAEREYRAIIEVCEQSLSPNHPRTAVTRNNLANALFLQGKYDEAEREHRVVLAIRERSLGPEHAFTLLTRNNLAEALRAFGRLDEAEEQQREALRLSNKVLGSGHRHTLMSEDNLASVYRDRRQFARAEKIHRKVLRARKRKLGANHPDVAQSQFNLALALRSQGKLRAALNAARQAAKVRSKAVGSHHRETREAILLKKRIITDIARKANRARRRRPR
jgi:protein O-mannosyl-transferase